MFSSNFRMQSNKLFAIQYREYTHTAPFIYHCVSFAVATNTFHLAVNLRYEYEKNENFHRKRSEFLSSRFSYISIVFKMSDKYVSPSLPHSNYDFKWFQGLKIFSSPYSNSSSILYKAWMDFLFVCLFLELILFYVIRVKKI